MRKVKLLDLKKINLDLIPIYKLHDSFPPKLEQIIKPEIENIRVSRFVPKPHPPISRKKVQPVNALER